MRFKLWFENSRKLPFYSSCVGSWGKCQDALDYLNQVSDDISHDEFLELADAHEYEKMFWNDATDELDYAVSFHKVPNWPIAYFRHSGIEYVFAEPQTIQMFQHAIDRDDLYDPGKDWFNTQKHTYDYVKTKNSFNPDGF